MTGRRGDINYIFFMLVYLFDLRGGIKEAYGHLPSYFDCYFQNREIK